MGFPDPPLGCLCLFYQRKWKRILVFNLWYLLSLPLCLIEAHGSTSSLLSLTNCQRLTGLGALCPADCVSTNSLFKALLHGCCTPTVLVSVHLSQSQDQQPSLLGLGTALWQRLLASLCLFSPSAFERVPHFQQGMWWPRIEQQKVSQMPESGSVIPTCPTVAKKLSKGMVCSSNLQIGILTKLSIFIQIVNKNSVFLFK